MSHDAGYHREESAFLAILPALMLSHAGQYVAIAGAEPEETAKVAIARRAKRAARPGYVKLVLTLELRRALAEQLSARAIREGKNLEGVVIDVLEAGSQDGPARLGR